MKRSLPGFTLMELMIVVVIVGLLAAVSIPMFLHFQARARQSEAKANIRCIYTTQQAYSHEADAYSGSFSLIGFSPERGNRYSYVLGTPGVYWPRNTAILAHPTPAMNAIEVDTFKFPSQANQPPTLFNAAVVGGAVRSFTSIAVGSIDASGTVDEWSISSTSRASAPQSSATTCASGNSASGDPCQDQGPL